jgi:predicted HicB family RNase H-like nuclease
MTWRRPDATKAVHAQRAARAKAEGVSLNALVLTFIAQGLDSSSPKPRAQVAA